MEIYLLPSLTPESYAEIRKQECRYCIDLDSIKLTETPFLNADYIKDYNFDKQFLTLTESGNKKLDQLEIPIIGRPAILTIDNEPIFGFWFWNGTSSLICDRVYALRISNGIDFRFNDIVIGHDSLGPKYAFHGNDPRFDSRIKEYLGRELEEK